MVICGRCDDTADDSIQCTACKLHFHYACSGITEKGYNKLGDRKSTWKCVSCKTPLPSSALAAKKQQESPKTTAVTAAAAGSAPQLGVPRVSADEEHNRKQVTLLGSPVTSSLTLENVMEEFSKLNKRLVPLLNLVEEFKLLKSDVSDLKHSAQDTSLAIAELEGRLVKVETSCKEISSLKEQLSKLDLSIADVQKDTASWDKWSRLNNVEIKGIPLKKSEDLFQILDSIQDLVDYKFDKNQINYISRVPMHGSKEKLILVSFINRYVKEDFVASARAFKKILASDLGFIDATNTVFVNDHLAPATKMLLTKTKSIATEKKYQHVWVKYSKIHVRKNNTSVPFVIHGQNDLNKIV